MSTETAFRTKPSLTIKRRLNAEPAKVFAALTDPAQIARWFGPQGILRVEAETDLRDEQRLSECESDEENQRVRTARLRPKSR